MTPFDGEEYGNSDSDTVSIGNSIPTITVDLTPDAPSSNDALVCTGTLTDDDNTLSADYEFSGAYTKSGVANCNNGICLAYVPSGIIQKGDTVICTMIPFDGEEYGLADFDSVTVGNLPPKIISSPVTEFKVDQDSYEYIYDVVAVDPDNDVLTYSLMLAPVGMSINPTSGLISWNPSKHDIGLHEVKVVVTDSSSATDSQAYTLSISVPEKIKYPRQKYYWDQLRILNEDYLKPGDEMIVVVEFENTDKYDVRNMKVTAMVDDLEMRLRKGPFTLKNGETVTKTFIMEIPYWAESGYYDLRVTLYGDGLRRVKHREFVVN